MKVFEDSSSYYQKISNLITISLHEKYTLELEYSDKLILPSSILSIIRLLQLPLPPLFSIGYSKNYSVPILCSVLEFTAPDDSIYIPNWILKKMGKKSKNSSNEAILELLQPKTRKNSSFYPEAKKIEIFTTETIDFENCKKGLQRYTVLNKGEWIEIMDFPTVYKIFIFGLFPKNRCIIKSSNFKISFIIIN